MLSVLLFSVLIASITAQAEEACPPGYALDRGPIPAAQKIEWVSCQLDDILKYEGLECGSVKVPLDYTGATPGVLTIPLVRWCADGTKWNGKSIVANPGGPGESGVEFLTGAGREYLLSITGEQFNIISFDPRGVGVTIPYHCKELTTVEPTAPLDNDTVLRNIYTSYAEQGAQCAKGAERNHGTLMGTAFVARDIDAIFQALDEDGLIRYLGYSYGTVLGATLAAMFPEKVDRMVLDGNVNPTAFYHGHYAEGFVDADESFKFFLRSCIKEGPDYCTFANFGSSEEDLLANFNEIRDAAQAGLIEHSFNEILDFLFGALEVPSRYFNASNMLSQAYEQIHTGESSYEWELAPSDHSSLTPMSIYAVDCGDWDDIPGTMEDWQEWLTEFRSKTEIFGDLAIHLLYRCSAWQLNAREKYLGSWTGIETKTPILFVNSPYDPRTPIESALNASAGFIGSAVLEHRAAGHCSNGSPSNCTKAATSNYFVTGELPDVSEPCFPDDDPFKTSSDAEDLRRILQGPERRSADFEYPLAIRQLQRENDYLFRRDYSYTTSPDDAAPTPTVTVANIPATCTPVSDQTISDEEAQKGLNDFKAACHSFTGDQWLYRLVCNTVG